MKNILKSIITIAFASMILVNCGGTSTSTPAATTGTSTASGTLTVSGDATVPTSVDITSANVQSDAFSSGVTLKATIGSDEVQVVLGLAHDGVAATQFPSANFQYYIGGQATFPSDYSTWGGFNAGKAVGLAVDEAARTATFTNVSLGSGIQYQTPSPGAGITQTTLTTTLVLNGTVNY
ncbi:MAG: hypothetical protein R8M14_04555 [Ghiorsea sp.]